MNRRNFLKSATVALTALALGIKRKISGEIVTGVGHSGVVTPQNTLSFYARVFRDRLSERLKFGNVSIQLHAHFDMNAARVTWLPGDRNSSGQVLCAETLVSYSILKDASASKAMIDWLGETFLEQRLDRLYA